MCQFQDMEGDDETTHSTWTTIGLQALRVVEKLRPDRLQTVVVIPKKPSPKARQV